MTVQVNSRLLKSRNPTEHKLKIENQIGLVIQRLDDGYNLIRFHGLRIKEKKRLVNLEWYVHETDFKIT